VRLEKFSYREQRAPGEEWEIDGLIFGQFNLVVGRNATGKTRLLKAIARAAAEQSKEVAASAAPAQINAVLSDVREDPEFPEARTATGPDLARWQSEAKGEWARRLQYLPFAMKMNLRAPAANGNFARLGLPEAYARGEQNIGNSFKARVVEWMSEIGYPIEGVLVREEKDGLAVGVNKEKHSATIPLQRLSQGEQRALTLLTFLALMEAEDKAITVLIDDFGEGLDFEHAASAAQFLLRRIPETKLQLIVATNDRYVMNAVPLEHWTVLVEEGNKTRVFNYANSKRKFDDFKFSGLNNFDFFSMDFASAGA
jgi:energy-coupling factor transporter ATP-binding protein EcfA2